jgi:hypothetical protein
MPQMADITVKKTDGTTDVVYTKLTPSSGDSSSAVWAPAAVGGSRALRPELRITSKANVAKTVRYVNGIVAWPVVQEVNSVDTVTDRNSLSFTLQVAEATPDADVNELVDQAVNLLASTLIRSTFKERFSPS